MTIITVPYGFTREVKFDAAYDKRSLNPGKNYGVHGVHIYFTLRCTTDGGGLTFSISTGWQLPHVAAELAVKHPKLMEPMAFSVDIHSLHSRYEVEHRHEKCPVTGKHCYFDGSGILGDEFLQILIEGGDEVLWKKMEQQYLEWRK